MNYRKFIIGFVPLMGLTTSYAGTMGPVVDNHAVPFLSGEVSGTWQEARGISINRFRTVIGSNTSLVRQVRIPDNLNPWGGRIAAGVISPYKNNFLFSAETAWNYFGDASTRSNVSSTSARAKVAIDGVDLLVGLFYKYNNYKLFAKVGTLFQRVTFGLSADRIQGSLNGETLTASGDYKGLQTSILPEIRTGLLYGITDVLDFSVSYMHAFGSTPKGTVNFNASGTTHTLSMNVNSQNPTLNSVLIGLQYNFV